MTLRPDPVVARGAYRMVALCRVRRAAHVFPTGGVAGWGEKHPEVILVAGPDGIAAFSPEGRRLDPGPHLARHPGLLDALCPGEGS